ncbi:uncharacterized protein LOC111640830 isoform X2 [Centruroides sculpturatus]|uniref:uncharacterized protein LOC111640830 isoform X2 n=1 Tax=Centruroides sculpturatus TaxID=218467 RepID=UPI000C6ED8A3|nr:uncharacterized protein LOC111640830 isoform X2 [Centruroides sculpturatus]
MAMVLGLFNAPAYPIFITHHRADTRAAKKYRSPLRPIPQYQYSREELWELGYLSSSKRVPEDLDCSFYTAFGRWNPSLYFDAKRREENQNRQERPRRNSLADGYGRRRSRSRSFHHDDRETPCQISFGPSSWQGFPRAVDQAQVFGGCPPPDGEVSDVERIYIRHLEEYLRAVILGRSEQGESAYDKLLKLLSDARSVLPCASISIGPWDKSKALTEADILGRLPFSPSDSAEDTTDDSGRDSRSDVSGKSSSLPEIDPIEGTSASTEYDNRRASEDLRDLASIAGPFTPTSVIRKVLLEKTSKRRTQSVSSDRNDAEDSYTGNRPYFGKKPSPRPEKTPASVPYSGLYDDLRYPLRNRSYSVPLPPTSPDLGQWQTPRSYGARQLLLTPYSSVAYPVVRAYYSQLQQILRCANFYSFN